MQLGIGLRNGHARLQPCSHSEKMHHVLRVQIELERHPKIDRCIGYKSSSNHTDDEIWLAIELNSRSNYKRIGAVAALPEAIAQHGDVTAIGAIFCRGEGASSNNRRAEHRKVVC